MALTTKQLALGGVAVIILIIIIVVAMSSPTTTNNPAPSPVYNQPAPAPAPVYVAPAPAPTPAPVYVAPAPTPSYVPGWQQASVAAINMRLGGNSETPATCRQLARDGAYVAWGHRNSMHPDPSFRNTCFAYRSIVPFAGNPSNGIDITGCVADGKSPSNGCI